MYFCRSSLLRLSVSMNVEDVGVGRYPGPPPNHRSEMWVEAISRAGCSRGSPLLGELVGVQRFGSASGAVPASEQGAADGEVMRRVFIKDCGVFIISSSENLRRALSVGRVGNALDSRLCGPHSRALVDSGGAEGSSTRRLFG